MHSLSSSTGIIGLALTSRVDVRERGRVVQLGRSGSSVDAIIKKGLEENV